MSEWLEEIKSNAIKEKVHYKYLDGSKSRWGYTYTISDDDFKRIIQQAERAEELDKKGLSLADDFIKLKEQNSIYKQALEEIKHTINVTPYREYSTNKIRHRLFDIATQALEKNN